MLTLTPNPSLHFSLLQSSKTHEEITQFHALSLKTNTFSHPPIAARLLSLYADPKINDLHRAKSIFDRIQEPTLVLHNIIIKSYVENQRSHDAISQFFELVHRLMPDGFTLPCVIKGCARLQAIQEGKQIHGLALKLGFGLDKFVQSSLVSMYAKCEKIEEAEKVFDEMNDRDLVSWNSLIDGYSKCGHVELAMQLFEKMPERDLFSWTALIDGFSRCGKVEVAREIFERMPNRNLVAWNSMINGYMKSGDFELAGELFNSIPERDLISWNSMISGYVSNRRFKEAVELFVIMLEEEFMPNHATFVSVISAVSGLASLSKGKWIHSYMIKNGFNLDGVLATLLIDMYSKCGNIENALTNFQGVAKKKLGHWTAIIVGLGLNGWADTALDLFQEMCHIGIKPNGITFIGVLNACSHAGLVNDGRRYFNIMIHDYRIEPSVEHYGCLVDILCRAGYLEEARQVVENMPIRPNKEIWMSLLSGSRVYRNIGIGEFAAQHLIESAPETTGCYILLSNIYAMAGSWDKVSRVREIMKNRGMKKDPGCSSIECRSEVHDFIVGDNSHSQTKEIYAQLREMRRKLELEGHVPDTSQVLLCMEGENEKEAELEKHSERLAIAFGLINVAPGSPIRIMKNLRVCNDCHSVTKLLSKIYGREIIVRDNSRFHHFKNGTCSCKDFW
uniref:Pentatricopeptide repeat-containing protein At2g29760ic n=1 Tax=Rhizophora mucronata TaxID=61149 RepID=A0A2P2LQR4_RHIMU